MFDFFFEGGVPGMSIVMLSGLGAIIWSIFSTAKFLKIGFIKKRHLDVILFLGSFSFFTGFLWQGIGLSEVLNIIQQYPNISPAAIAGGLKVSLISTISGAILFAIAGIFWICLRYMNAKKEEA